MIRLKILVEFYNVSLPLKLSTQMKATVLDCQEDRKKQLTMVSRSKYLQNSSLVLVNHISWLFRSLLLSNTHLQEYFKKIKFIDETCKDIICLGV